MGPWRGEFPVFPELRAGAVRMVLDRHGERAARWSAIRSIAEKIGCSGDTRRDRVRRAERDQGARARWTGRADRATLSPVLS